MRHTANQATSSFSTFSLTEQTKGIFSISFEQAKLAVLDVKMTSKLVALRQMSGVRCEAVVPTGTILKRKAKSSSPFQISVNIFGPRKAADEVSAALSKVHAFLQHPQTLNDGVEYSNPDMLIFPGQKTSMNHLIGTSRLLLEESKLSRDVRGILDSLSEVAESDELGHLGGLFTTLTQHQQQGVRFVLRREDEVFCRGLSAHVSQIAGAESFVQTGDMLFGMGGLIADVMGIGKTLTMLTSILHTANKAQDFNYFGHTVPGVQTEILLTKATLVVVPSVRKCSGSGIEKVNRPKIAQADNKFQSLWKTGSPRSQREWDFISIARSQLSQSKTDIVQGTSRRMLFDIYDSMAQIDHTLWILSQHQT